MNSENLFGYILIGIIFVPLAIVAPVYFFRNLYANYELESGAMPTPSRMAKELLAEFESSLKTEDECFSYFNDELGAVTFFLRNHELVGALTAKGLCRKGIVEGNNICIDYRDGNHVELNCHYIGHLDTGFFREGVHFRGGVGQYSGGYWGKKRTGG